MGRRAGGGRTAGFARFGLRRAGCADLGGHRHGRSAWRRLHWISVYAGKAMAGLIGLVRSKGRFGTDDTLVWLHTGGLAGHVRLSGGHDAGGRRRPDPELRDAIRLANAAAP